MKRLIKKIRIYTDAGIILNHMYLFDELERVMNDRETEKVL